MKRKDLVRHLENNACYQLREGAKHTVYKNTKNGEVSAIPRHREIKNNLCRKICKDLGIAPPF